MKILKISYDKSLKFDLDETVTEIDDGFSENNSEKKNIIVFLIEARKKIDSVEIILNENENLNEILKMVLKFVNAFLKGYKNNENYNKI